MGCFETAAGIRAVMQLSSAKIEVPVRLEFDIDKGIVVVKNVSTDSLPGQQQG